mgnify:CR=1 FL=1
MLSIIRVAQSSREPAVSIIAIGSGYTVTVIVSEFVHCVCPISITSYCSIVFIPLLNVSVKFIVEFCNVSSTNHWKVILVIVSPLYGLDRLLKSITKGPQLSSVIDESISTSGVGCIVTESVIVLSHPLFVVTFSVMIYVLSTIPVFSGK